MKTTIKPNKPKSSLEKKEKYECENDCNNFDKKNYKLKKN